MYDDGVTFSGMKVVFCSRYDRVGTYQSSGVVVVSGYIRTMIDEVCRFAAFVAGDPDLI